MSPVLLAGTIVVQFALICYSIGVITEQRRHLVTPFVLWFLTVGVFFDVTATVLMIVGSPNSPFTLHGFIGYSSLVGMLVETALAWRHYRCKRGVGVPRGLHLYARLAYIWWVLAYITGALLVALKK